MARPAGADPPMASARCGCPSSNHHPSPTSCSNPHLGRTSSSNTPPTPYPIPSHDPLIRTTSPHPPPTRRGGCANTPSLPLWRQNTSPCLRAYPSFSRSTRIGAPQSPTHRGWSGSESRPSAGTTEIVASPVEAPSHPMCIFFISIIITIPDDRAATAT